MDSHCFFDSRINVVIHSCFLKVLLDWKDPARNLENRCISKESRKLLSIHSSRSDNDLNISPLLCNFLQNAKQHISVQTSLMGFVHNNGRVHLELVVVQTFSKQDTISHVLDLCLVGGAILETD